MVALLASLQLKLNLRSFRGGATKIAGLVIVSIYGLFLVALAWGLAFIVQGEPPAVFGHKVTLIFACITFLWPVVAVLFGANNQLSPPRFATLPVTAKTLQPGMVVASMLSIGGIGLSLFSIAYVIVWSASTLTLVVSVVSLVLGLLLSALTVRLALAGMSAAMSSRRFKDLSILVFGLVVMLIGIGPSMLESRGDFKVDAAWIDEVGIVIGWTPLGWAWSLPIEVYHGAWGIAAIKIVATLGAVAVVWLSWRVFLERALTSPVIASGGSVKVKENSLIDKLMPATPAGAIGARGLRYLLRDPRRKMQAMSLVILPLILTFTTKSSGIELLVVVPATIVLIVFPLMSPELCYDGSALWQQTTAGVSGTDDRWGRIFMWLPLLGVYFTTVTIGFAAWTNGWNYLGLALASGAGLLFSAAGVASWIGAWSVYPVAPAGEMLASRGNLGAVGASFLGMFVLLVLGVINAGPAILSLLVYPWLGWVAPIWSLLTGFGFMWLGVRMGGARLDASWPEVVAAVTWSKN